MSGIDSTTSVSKGCFVIRPERNRKRKFEETFPLQRGESKQHCRLRHEIFQETWSRVEDQVNSLHANINNDVFAKIVEFIDKSMARYKSGGKSEIPTGVLVTGVNMPDHDAIFSQLYDTLLKTTPYISRLCSKSCSNLKLILKEATMQIETNGPQHNPLSLSNGLNPVPQRGTAALNVLSEWYSSVECGKEKRPVVFIFEDFESFNPVAMQDFISICSLHAEELPIVLLFGVATIPAIIHKLLPCSISSHLSIEKFHAQPAINYLLQVINCVFITADFSFKLGPQVFQFLYENFLFHDFSLKNFILGLKFCMMDHFYGHKLSVLCSNSRSDTIRSFSHEKLEIIRKSPSFRRYTENQGHESELLSNDEFTINVLSAKLKDVNFYHHHFFPVLRCLTALVSRLPGYPLGKRCRDVYEHCLKTSVKELDIYERAIKMAYFLAKDELVPVIEECIELLTLNMEKFEKICSDFSQYVESLKRVLENFDKATKENVECLPCDKCTEKPSRLSYGVTNRFELREKLKTAVYNNRRKKPFENMRESALSILDKMFRKYLVCPAEICLHEVFYYDDINEVKQHLSGCPRVAIQAALNNPRYYLNCSCCNLEADCIQDTLPDISVAFKLHLECGRLINLFDWLQAFVMCIEPRRKTATNDRQQQILQARFIQAVSELQFLGFIKATKKKTDHVARLTWGSC